jgi:hypothetical protein
VRFALLHAAILTAALFVFANDQAHAIPDFRDGWVDQGGQWHQLWPASGNGTAGELLSATGEAANGDTHDGTPHDHDINAGDNNTAGGGSRTGDNNVSNSISEDGDIAGSGNNDQPHTGDTDTGLAGLNIVFNDLPLDNGPHGGSEASSDNGAHDGSGGTQHDDAGGSSVTSGGSRLAVPEPASIALLASALIAAGAARRRARTNTRTRKNRLTADDCL